MADMAETEFVTLDGWVTVEEAAAELGTSGTRVRQLIGDNRFRKVARLGSRPFYLLRADEVRRMADGRSDARD